MKTLLKLTAIITLTLILSACGGGGNGGNDDNASDGTAQGSGGIDKCISTNTDQGQAKAKELSTKTLKGTTTNAKLRIWHTSDGKRKACVVSGSVEAE